ncbi:hydroxyacid dehydrogenase [Aureimonas altamirensis]|uniref:hydroxyacid dehydrogenase n=1 Tax=Aureimonas altamirensis TaxID=370622 RepID=UPI002036C6EE|nr:hydroxyacid dehydrogenase [Aureimonas altamirensis]MCM2502832.1 hydroxyacid dehydrogenase [Aureimonas altamirensis]
MTMQHELSVLITGGAIAPEATALLEERRCKTHYVDFYASSEELADVASRYRVDAILVRSGTVSSKVIDASDRLRVIAKHGSGVDNIDLAAASRRGVPVLRAVAANARAVAEHAFALMGCLLKDIPTLDRQVRGGVWPKATFRGNDIAGSVLGIIGYGQIGRHMEQMATSFGMQVLVYDPLAPREFERAGVRRVDDLDELLQASDAVSLHCPLTDTTRHLINRDRLARMKSSAILINTARGGLVDEVALCQALLGGVIAGAGLDSFEQEPPRPDNPLWALPNVVVTPHVGGVTRGALRQMGLQAVRHILHVSDGHAPDPECVANPRYADAAMAATANEPRDA